MRNEKKRLPLLVSLSWILGSALFFSGPLYLSYYYYVHLVEQKQGSSKYTIVALVQTGPEKEQLHSAYLAEQLGLSVDTPTNLYSFNTKKGVKRLLRSPVIKEASIKKMSPGALIVDYVARHPIAYLHNYSNTVIDEEGRLFPLKPFFTPKTLPRIQLGADLFLKENIWGSSVDGEEFRLALQLIQAINKNSWLTVDMVDLQRKEVEDPGKREITLTLMNNSLFVRLNVEDPQRSLRHFFTLFKELYNQEELPTVIDMRLENLAYLSY